MLHDELEKREIRVAGEVIEAVSRDAIVKAVGRILTLLPVEPFDDFCK
jgi:hypothetical protein